MEHWEENWLSSYCTGIRETMLWGYMVSVQSYLQPLTPLPPTNRIQGNFGPDVLGRDLAKFSTINLWIESWNRQLNDQSYSSNFSLHRTIISSFITTFFFSLHSCDVWFYIFRNTFKIQECYVGPFSWMPKQKGKPEALKQFTARGKFC